MCGKDWTPCLSHKKSCVPVTCRHPPPFELACAFCIRGDGRTWESLGGFALHWWRVCGEWRRDTSKQGRVAGMLVRGPSLLGEKEKVCRFNNDAKGRREPSIFFLCAWPYNAVLNLFAFKSLFCFLSFILIPLNRLSFFFWAEKAEVQLRSLGTKYWSYFARFWKVLFQTFESQT